MNQRTLAGLIIGLLAIAAGSGSLGVALLTRRRREQIAATYASSGGVVYTAVQVGCASMLILIGLVLVSFVVLARP